MNNKKMIWIILLVMLCVIGFAQNIKVEYMCGDKGYDSDGQIKPYFQIVNEGRHRVNLDQLTLHYYYTKEGRSREKFHVEYAKIGKRNVKGSFRKDYLGISFRRAGLLNPGDSTGPIEIRINKTDWSNYNEKDDYSYGKHADYKAWEKVTCYYRGKLIWGVEPGSGKTPKPVETEEPTDEPTPTIAPGIYGDVNDDGVANIVDALMICQIYTGLQITGISLNLAMADVNLDGDIDLRDVLQISQHYVGLSQDITKPLDPPGDYDSYFTADEGKVGLRVKNKIYSGGTGSIGIEFNPGRKAIAGYLVNLYYDPSILELDKSTGVGGVVAKDGYVAVVNATEPGIIKISGFDVIGVDSDGTLDFLEILFKGLTLGDTSVRIEVVNLIDQYGLPIGETQIEYLGLEIFTPYNPTPYVSPEPSPTPEPEEGLVSLLPELTRVSPGDDFVIGCHIDSGRQMLAAYTFSITYDATVIAANNSKGTNSVTVGTNGFLAAANSKPGLLRVTGFDVGGIGPGNDLHLIDLNFIAISDGETDINLVIDTMVNPAVLPFGNKTAIGCSVVVKTDDQEVHEPGAFWFEPPNLSLTSGNTFDTEIHLNSGDKSVAAYSLVIEFDENILTPDRSYGVVAGSDGYLTAANIENGKVKIAGFTLSQVVGEDLDFLKIRWIAKKQGLTELIIGSPVLSTPDYQTIGTPAGDKMKVYILSEDLDDPSTPTPGLTVTATPKPTPTLVPKPTETPIAHPELIPGAVLLEPSVTKVEIGENFTLECKVVTGNQFLAAYTLAFSFNPEILKIDTTIGEDGIVIAPEGFMAAHRIDRGRIIISGFDINGKGADSKFHLLDLNFKAIGAGKTEVAVDVETLVDYKTDVLGTPKGIGAMVYVNDPTMIAQLGHARFEPSEIKLTNETSFQTEVFLNIGASDLGAFDVTIEYDPELVYPDTKIGVSGVEGPKEYFIAANPEFKKPGVFKIAGYKEMHDIIVSGNNVKLLTINWIVKSSGSTDLSMTVPVLVSEKYETIGTPTGDTISVQIDVPEPTITPDPLAGMVWFSSGEAPKYRLGDTFTLTMNVNTGTQVVAAYGVKVLYDESIIKPDLSVGDKGVTAGADGFVTAVKSNPGELVISGFDPFENKVDSKFELIDITWKAVGVGSFPIKIVIDELIDQQYKPVGKPHTGLSDPYITVLEALVEGAGNVFFVPGEVKLTEGTKFQTEVHVNTGNQSLGAFGFDIIYDPLIVYPDVEIGYDGVVGREEFIVTANADFKPGFLRIGGSKAKPNVITSGTDLNFLTINWIARSNGTCELKMDVPILVSDTAKVVGNPQGDSMVVEIDTPELSKTEEPTPKPTPEPTPIDRTGKLWFSGDTPSKIIVDDSFKLTLNVDTGKQILAAYGIKVLYDENVLAPEATIGDKGVTAGRDGFVTAVKSNPGELVISGFNVKEDKPSSQYQLIDINWKAIGIGASTIKVVIDDLVDPVYDTIGNPHSIPFSVEVQPQINNDKVGQISFAPSQVKLTDGMKFKTELYVNAGAYNLGAYEFLINYDSESIVPDIQYEGHGVVNQRKEMSLSANPVFEPGVLKIGAFKMDFDVVTTGSNLHLLTIHWIAKSNSVSKLDLDINVLVSNNYADVGNPRGDTISVVIDSDDLIIDPETGTTPGTVWMTPLEGVYQMGENFTGTVRVNTGKQSLAAYQIRVFYNPDILGLDKSVGQNGVLPGKDGFVTVVNPLSGEIVINGFTVTGGDIKTNFELIDIMWKTLGPGKSDIKITIDDLVDSTYDTIGSPKSLSAVISVEPEQVVEKKVGQIWFDNYNKNPAVGSDFTTDIYVNAGDNLIGAYQFNIYYDPEIVLVDTSKGIEGVTIASGVSLAAVNPIPAGSLKFTGFDIKGMGSGEKLLFATIHWKALSDNTAEIKLENKSLIDLTTRDIGVPQGDTIIITPVTH